MFSDTNRLGVPGSLHRISAMRDREGVVYGLTYRVGRHVPGEQEMFQQTAGLVSGWACCLCVASMLWLPAERLLLHSGLCWNVALVHLQPSCRSTAAALHSIWDAS
jgi:hypothetical protein